MTKNGCFLRFLTEKGRFLLIFNEKKAFFSVFRSKMVKKGRFLLKNAQKCQKWPILGVFAFFGPFPGDKRIFRLAFLGLKRKRPVGGQKRGSPGLFSGGGQKTPIFMGRTPQGLNG